MNPIYQLLQALPTNGWTTVIAGLGALLYGIGGIITGKIDQAVATESIFIGLGILGLGNKMEKNK